MTKKEERKAIFDKYKGHCSYCGEPLQKGWHVDHSKPLRRNRDGSTENPENDTFENKIPACASCNINKHSMTVEEFRSLIKGFVKSLNIYSTQYKIAKRYGLLKETDNDIIFHFEKHAQKIDL